VQLTLYSGKVKTVTFNIKVEKARIEIVIAKSVMNADSTYNFRAKAYGFYSRDIAWYSDDETIITIDETTGKATAKSEGITYITAEAGDAKQRIEVTVR
jgi:uncharacterized protein YjdB